MDLFFSVLIVITNWKLVFASCRILYFIVFTFYKLLRPSIGFNSVFVLHSSFNPPLYLLYPFFIPPLPLLYPFLLPHFLRCFYCVRETRFKSNVSTSFPSDHQAIVNTTRILSLQDDLFSSMFYLITNIHLSLLDFDSVMIYPVRASVWTRDGWRRPIWEIIQWLSFGTLIQGIVDRED